MMETVQDENSILLWDFGIHNDRIIKSSKADLIRL